MDMLSGKEIQDAGLDDWRRLAQGLYASFRVDSSADAFAFASAVGEVCAAVGQDPDIRLTGTFVDVKVGVDVTQLDVDLARQISAIAQSRGLKSDPSAVVQLEIALDTADREAIGPFWAAVLTGGTHKGNDVFGPGNRIANLWFQGTEPHETPRQRFHIDLWLPPEVVPARIEAALAAGGTVAYDAEAPAYTVLADPQGNKVCLCTYLDR